MLLRILVWGVLSVIIPISGGYAVLALDTFNTIIPGVSIDGTPLAGKTVAEAEEIIAQKAAFFEYGKIILSDTAHTWEQMPRDLGITFDATVTAHNAYEIGRKGNIIENTVSRIRALTVGSAVSHSVHIDEERFAAYANEAFNRLDRAATDATIQFDPATKRFIVTESHVGSIVNKSKLKYDLRNAAVRPSERTIRIAMQDDAPLITAEMLADAVNEANAIYDRAPIGLTHAGSSNETATNIPRTEKKYEITKDQIKDMLIVAYRDNAPRVDVQPDAVHDFLMQIAPSINTKPRNAVLTVRNEKAQEFAISHNGVELDIDKSVERIREGILGGNPSIELTATITFPEIRTETIENLGLVSLLARGESDFSGSPASRIFNIKLGAEKMNGVLIKPGETFSFMETIGDVGAKEGYQFALVIKNGGDLVREYGGGLCQVSTTMFRAAVLSGLPIVERFPHSLPVAYYNPQGFDAAVYSPHPDLRFTNDTPSHILIQTKIVGSKLYFEFYGTPDGREVKIIGPVEYDRKPDGSLKAKLTQEIYKDDTLIFQRTFTSSYRSPKKEVVQKNPLE